MLKASLNFHDPIEIYDHFDKVFGKLSMLIKANSAILTFQNKNVYQNIISSKGPIIIKGLPVKLSIYKDGKFMTLNNSISLSQSFENSAIQEEQSGQIIPQRQHQAMGKLVTKIRRIGADYGKKIKQIQSQFEQENAKQKVINFKSFFDRKLNARLKQIINPMNRFINDINNYQARYVEEPIDLEPSFISERVPTFGYQNKDIVSPHYVEGITYLKDQKLIPKRLCRLNENQFISTQTNKTQLGQIQIYDKNQEHSKLLLEIVDIPYSLLCLDEYILIGSQLGYIHYVDISRQNAVNFSSRLAPSTILQMEHYQFFQAQNKRILALTMGARQGEETIRLIQFQRESLTPGVSSANFNIIGHIACHGTTMSMAVLPNGGVVYGQESINYILPDLQRSDDCRQIIVDQNIMRIKTYEPNILIEATQFQLGILDLRNQNSQFECKFNKLTKPQEQIYTFQILSQNLLMYGGSMGTLGTVDLRKPNQIMWQAPKNSHTEKVSDILNMGSSVISSDSGGIVKQWKNK